MLGDHQRERYSSNLAFFDAFTSLSLSREEPQARLRQAHVLVLGAGGLGSAVLMNLAGLGIGAVTVVDQDLVELRNFARQFTYTEAEIGQPKADRVAAWLRAFDPTVRVVSFLRRVEAPQDVTDLLAGTRERDRSTSSSRPSTNRTRWIVGSTRHAWPRAFRSSAAAWPIPKGCTGLSIPAAAPAASASSGIARGWPRASTATR